MTDNDLREAFDESYFKPTEGLTMLNSYERYQYDRCFSAMKAGYAAAQAELEPRPIATVLESSDADRFVFVFSTVDDSWHVAQVWEVIGQEQFSHWLPLDTLQKPQTQEVPK